MSAFVAAVDVGTGSARAGIFDLGGRLLGRAEQAIALSRPRANHADQDSGQIWRAVCAAVRAARDRADVAPSAIAAVAFDATCSLVVRDAEGQPVSVSPGAEDRWDTILWLDQRARAEAAEVTATGHPVIAHCGGAMSPEMQLPKLLWLKRQMPEHWARAARVSDLVDFLAWKASGSTARSHCALTCKWSYRGQCADPWPRDLIDLIGLADLEVRTGVPQRSVPVGSDLGPLRPEAAAALGLTETCRVAAGMIDAHAGALGAIGAHGADLGHRFALIAGTSTCVMALSDEPRFVPGFWGPYRDAVLPGKWLIEGGQSASGALLDHICTVWGGAEPDAAFHARVCARIAELRAEEGWDLARRLNVLPDFAGNRSPHADPAALGVVSGLSLDLGFDGLCRLYWRTAVALACALRLVVDRLAPPPAPRPRLHVAGGHARNPMLVQLYADATGCVLELPEHADVVLLGSAVVAATAAGAFPDLASAARAMQAPVREIHPDPAATEELETDFRILLEMQEHRRRIDRLATGASRLSDG